MKIVAALLTIVVWPGPMVMIGICQGWSLVQWSLVLGLFHSIPHYLVGYYLIYDGFRLLGEKLRPA